MSIDKSRHVFGSEPDVDLAIEQGLIDAYDVLFLSDGRVGWVDRNGGKVITAPGELFVSQATPPDDTSLLWIDTSDDLDVSVATDEIIDLLINEDFLPVVVDTDGSILTDEGGNILLW